MPVLKRKVSQAEDRRPIGVYDGPLPPDGTYAAEVRSVKLVDAKNTDNQALNVLAVLDSHNKDGQAAAYDGYSTWTKLWLEGSDFGSAKEKAFYEAVAGKADVDVQYDDKVAGNPIVTKIGGVNPVSTRVYVELRTETDPTGQYGPRQVGFFIYPDPKNNGKAAAATPAADEPDEELDVEAEAKPAPAKRAAKKAPAKKLAAVPDPAPEAEERPDYGAMTLPAIKKAAREAGINTEGKSRKDLIEDLESVADADVDTEGPKNPQDITNMDEEDLIEWLNERYEEGDFIDGDELMARKDIVEILVQDKHITEF